MWAEAFHSGSLGRAARSGGLRNAEGTRVCSDDAGRGGDAVQGDDEMLNNEEAREEGSGSLESSSMGGMQHYVFDGNKKGKWLIDATDKGNVRIPPPQPLQPRAGPCLRRQPIPSLCALRFSFVEASSDSRV